MHNHAVLSYFPNDGIDNHGKDGPFDENEARDLAHALCTILQLYPMGHYALLCGKAEAWGLGDHYKRRAAILYEVFTERNVPFLGEDNAQAFFVGMLRKDGWNGNDLFHFGAQEANKKLAASYYLTLVTRTAHDPIAIHTLDDLGATSTVPRDAVLGAVPRAKQLEAQEESSSSSSPDPRGVFPKETEHERLQRITSFRSMEAHFDLLNILGSVELTEAQSVGARFLSFTMTDDIVNHWVVFSLTELSPLRAIGILPGSRLYLVNNKYAHLYDVDDLKGLLSQRPVRLSFQLTRDSVHERLQHIGAKQPYGSRYASHLESTLFEFHRFALVQNLTDCIYFDNEHIISQAESEAGTHVPVSGHVLFGLKGMYQAIPDYDITKGLPIGPEDPLRHMFHGTSIASATAILSSVS